MNKKATLKRISAGVITCALLVSAVATANAAEIESKPLRAVIASEPTNTYKQYLEGKVTQDENAGSKISPYVSRSSAVRTSSALPAAYKSVTTDVRDQGAYNTCWAFSALGTLETYLVKDGKGINDLAEAHLAWWSTSEYNSDGYGWQMANIDTGGYSLIGAGYLTSWMGAKSEADFPYNNSCLALPSNMDSAKNQYNVTGLVFVDNDIESVKSAIYEYGAVATSYNSGDGYNDDYTAYYSGEETYYFAGHAITIVGWDDNYSVSNFNESNRPSQNGAWLIKNSWGKDVCDEGYLWISYEDRYLLDPNTWGVSYAVTSARTANSYDKLYQNETAGATYSTYMLDESNNFFYTDVTYVNLFDFDSEHNKLESVIFCCENLGADYTVYYIPVVDNAPVADQSKWQELASGVVTQTGYVNAATKVFNVPSGKGAIGVNIDSTSNEEPAFGCVSEWLGDGTGEYIFMPKQMRNQSFVIAGGEVTDLVDIYLSVDDNIGGTLVIKALTTSNIIGDINGDNRITTMDAFMLQRSVAGLINLDSDATINSDVNYDGRPSALDAFLIQKKTAGLIKEF